MSLKYGIHKMINEPERIDQGALKTPLFQQQIGYISKNPDPLCKRVDHGERKRVRNNYSKKPSCWVTHIIKTINSSGIFYLNQMIGFENPPF